VLTDKTSANGLYSENSRASLAWIQVVEKLVSLALVVTIAPPYLKRFFEEIVAYTFRVLSYFHK
jgi:hypothetical protein